MAATVGAVLIPKQPLTWQHLHTDTKFAAICGASALWGIYSGAQPVVESIFADSVATGVHLLSLLLSLPFLTWSPQTCMISTYSGVKSAVVLCLVSQCTSVVIAGLTDF